MVWGCFWVTCSKWWDHEFCSLQRNSGWRISSHRFISWSSRAVGLYSRVMIRNTAASPPLNVSKRKKKRKQRTKAKWRLWSGLVKIPTQVRFRCLWMTLNTLLKKVSSVAEPKNSGSKFFHSDVEDSLPVITNSWLQFLLPWVAQPFTRLRFTQGRVGLETFSLTKRNPNLKTALYIYSGYLSLINIKLTKKTLMIWIVRGKYHMCLYHMCI